MAMIIGLTGGIGSGKSTVASMLLVCGIPVIDADNIARALTAKKTIIKAITQTFGDDILTKTGEIDRKKLGQIVFSNPKLLHKLENILHPKIEEARQQEITRLLNQGHEIIVYMAPLLLEKNLQSMVNKTIAVIADVSIAKKRIKHRDHLSDLDIAQRMKSQLSNEERVKLADAIIDNNGTIDELLVKLEQCWLKITNKPLRYIL